MKNLKSLLTAPKADIRAEGNTLTIDGVIGDFFDELDSKTVCDKIDAIDGDITLRLNSPGGDVFGGIAIMNRLKAHKGKITVVVEGLAASIASVIAIGAADELRMAEGAMLMIHNAWSFAVGNASELRKTAETLDTMSANIASIYVNHSGKSMEEIVSAMDAETWFTAEEAKNFGFKVITDEHKATLKNYAMLSSFNCVPDNYIANSDVSKPLNVRDLENALHSFGFSRKDAKTYASRVASAQQCDATEADNVMLNQLDRVISDRKQLFK